MHVHSEFCPGLNSAPARFALLFIFTLEKLIYCILNKKWQLPLLNNIYTCSWNLHVDNHVSFKIPYW